MYLCFNFYDESCGCGCGVVWCVAVANKCMQHLRLFASDVCGMLREKEPLIAELQAAVLGHLRLQASRRFEHWKQRQDRILQDMRQVGGMVILLTVLLAGCG
jgi:hypothetical protein